MLKERIKQSLPPFATRVIGRGIHNFRHMRYLVKRTMQRYEYKDLEKSLQQEIITYDSAIELSTSQELSAVFDKHDIQYRTGEYAVYVFQESDIAAINEDLLNYYPRPFGLKFFRSSDVAPDGTPYYTSHNVSNAATPITMRAVGSIREKAEISNILHLRDVAPRVYDIVRFRTDGEPVFAMVVQHIDGDIVTGDAGVKFVQRFKQVLAEEGVSTLGSKQHADYEPPLFNNNIVANDTGAYYVDIQNFAMLDAKKGDEKLKDSINDVTHFGQGRLMRSSRYAYQTIPGMSAPGKRDTLQRIAKIDNLLKRHDVSFQNSTVLDVGCNLGTFLMYGLSNHALWGVGLDTPEIAGISQQFLFSRGFSRTDIIGCDLTDNNVSELLPRKRFDFVFYMSIENHIGFPEWLNQLELKYFLYEGHQKESVEQIHDKFTAWAPHVKILESAMMQDGDSLPRPIILGRL